jgi:ribonuclease T2
MKNGVLPILLTLALAVTPVVTARSRKQASSTPGAFDYYLLSLSWAPTWCGQDPSRATSAECKPDRHTGFIVHGFWPESDTGKNPEFCGQASRVPDSTVKLVLPLMLSANLVQHEWAAHGTCSGLSSYAYFTALVQARGEVQIPVQLNSAAAPINLSPLEIDAQFAAVNSNFPKAAFRTACVNGMLEEERICFNKSFKPQACTANVSECGTGRISIPPTL